MYHSFAFSYIISVDIELVLPGVCEVTEDTLVQQIVDDIPTQIIDSVPQLPVLELYESEEIVETVMESAAEEIVLVAEVVESPLVAEEVVKLVEEIPLEPSIEVVQSTLSSETLITLIDEALASIEPESHEQKG